MRTNTRRDENGPENSALAHAPHLGHPSPWVARFAPLVAAGGTVLDLACGGGRHARFLAGHGHPVVAVDRDADQFPDPPPGVAVVAADLENGSPWPLPGQHFAGIVVANYLHRPLFPRLLDSLAADGVLIYETFMQGNEHYSRPRNPDHLLAEGELPARLGDRLRVVAFEQGLVTRTECPGVVQRICAVLPADPARPTPLPEPA